MSAATGLARVTVRKGRRELARGGPPVGRIRRPGAGRPNLRWQADCRDALEVLVDPLTRGDPTSPLRWTCKSRANAGKGPRTPTATPSLSTSMRPWTASCSVSNRSSRSIPRRRNWSATARRAGANGSRRARRRRCASTISRPTRAGRPFLTVSMTWAATRRGARPRHARLRRRLDSPLVAAAGAPRLPHRDRAVHHGRRRRQQRLSRPRLKAGTAAVRRRDAAPHPQIATKWSSDRL